MKKIRFAILFAVVLIVFSSFPVSAASKKMKPYEIHMAIGKTKKLKIKTKQKIEWKSLAPNVATISKKGKVKAKSTGSTIISARVGRNYYSCMVYVHEKNYKLKRKFKRTGIGTVTVRTLAGETDGSYTPTIYIQRPQGLMECSVHFACDISSVDMSLPVWIYVDKILEQKCSVGRRTISGITIHGKRAKRGKHVIEFIQYAKNNPKKKAIFYRKIKYRTDY